jgi:hypothetical protein
MIKYKLSMVIGSIYMNFNKGNFSLDIKIILSYKK